MRLMTISTRQQGNAGADWLDALAAECEAEEEAANESDDLLDAPRHKARRRAASIDLGRHRYRSQEPCSTQSDKGSSVVR